MTGFFRRVLRASLLHADTYEEVEADRGALGQSVVVVLLSAVGAGLGTFETHGASGVLGHSVTALVGWYVWAYVTYLIGTRLLPGPQTESDPGELLRTTGFSAAPGVLRIFVAIPPIAGFVYLACTLWMLATMVVAVRQALDYESTLRAIAVCAIGFPIYAVFLVVNLLLQGPWPV